MFLHFWMVKLASFFQGLEGNEKGDPLSTSLFNLTNEFGNLPAET